jgi:hypothetical protein
MTTAYAEALTISRIASAKFFEIRNAYHAGTVSDAIFLAAQIEDKSAQKAFDAAYILEESIEEEIEDNVCDFAQCSLFA